MSFMPSDSDSFENSNLTDQERFHLICLRYGNKPEPLPLINAPRFPDSERYRYNSLEEVLQNIKPEILGFDFDEFVFNENEDPENYPSLKNVGMVVRYLITVENALRLGPEGTPRINNKIPAHSYLADGKSCLAAGNLYLSKEDKKTGIRGILLVNNKSSDYCTPFQAVPLALFALRQNNLSFADKVVLERQKSNGGGHLRNYVLTRQEIEAELKNFGFGQNSSKENEAPQPNPHSFYSQMPVAHGSPERKRKPLEQLRPSTPIKHKHT